MAEAVEHLHQEMIMLGVLRTLKLHKSKMREKKVGVLPMISMLMLLLKGLMMDLELEEVEEEAEEEAKEEETTLASNVENQATLQENVQTQTQVMALKAMAEEEEVEEVVSMTDPRNASIVKKKATFPEIVQSQEETEETEEETEMEEMVTRGKEEMMEAHSHQETMKDLPGQLRKATMWKKDGIKTTLRTLQEQENGTLVVVKIKAKALRVVAGETSSLLQEETPTILDGEQTQVSPKTNRNQDGTTD